ncbi:hypothetical protein GpartN1_g4818.t1 [Galdieria partita]|uniref:Uncharacterized protein n=1 Tax=Galdieria partita TaxID=83374 RepID=A0A9C7US11_9RHOD|nr:hypothetical protein GpartN1_g1851.t1 [Galdieria partita]GJQ13027.1 hypothetical protein GpartN1_g4818.t1 [Galdieria partita]
MSFHSKLVVGTSSFRVKYSQPVDISISVRGHVGEFTVEAFGLGQPKTTEVCQAYGGIGVNCTSIEFNPHANGTHTECVGHVAEQKRFYVEDCFPGIIQGACLLISVEPVLVGENKPENIVYSVVSTGDRVISGELVKDAIVKTLEAHNLVEEQCPSILVVRTLPNDLDKYPTANNSVNWPYFTSDAIQVLDQFQIQHLLVDTPSLDRHPDGGKVESHKYFWRVSSDSLQSPRKSRSLTELCCIPDPVKDGIYFIILSLSSFAFLDAVPSRPILFPLEVDKN